MPAQLQDIIPEFSRPLFEPAYYCLLTWNGSAWNLHVEGNDDVLLTSTTTQDFTAAQTEADSLAWGYGNKRFTVWNLIDSNNAQAYVV
jgi:hypothetical protein